MNDTLKETLSLLVNEVLGKFNFDYFKNLSRTNQRPTTQIDQVNMAHSGKTHPEIEYAKSMLPELGVGSSRRTFALSGGKALKIAKNEKGQAQNKAEVEIYQANQGSSLVTRVFDFSPDYKWSVAEIVKPLSGEEFHSRFEIIPDVFRVMMAMLGQSEKRADVALDSYIKELYRELKTGEAFFTTPHGQTRPIKHFLPGLVAASKNRSFMKWVIELVDFCRNNSLDFGDIDPDHFGRTVDGRIILFDFGLTKQVWKDYYENRPGNPS